MTPKLDAAASDRTAATDSHDRRYSLQPLASSSGVICALALDHRDAMRNAFNRAGVPNVSESTMLACKSRIVRAVADHASALLLDEVAIARCRRNDLGLLVPLEQQGHEPLGSGRLTRLLEDFGPVNARALRAHACKLLLYYRPDHLPTATKQLALVAWVAAHCHRHGLALAVEPLIYRLEGEDELSYSRRFGDLVAAAAADLTTSGADLLKLQFAGDASACERVTEAAWPLPWTLLGGAEVDGDEFAQQLRTACEAGACGFIAGRAIWGGALGLTGAQQASWLRDRAGPLLERLADIAENHARRIP